MANVWPWLVVAGVGALHGLNPLTGWALAAAWGVRSGDRARARWALVPIAIGHIASIAVVAVAVASGLALDRGMSHVLATVLLIVAVTMHLCGHTPKGARVPAGHAGLALWSFIVASTHGSGLMLVPALMPLCAGSAGVSGMAATESLALGLAAVGLHMGAMLLVSGVLASAVSRGMTRNQH